MVHRDVEESLDLRRVQVQRQDAVHARLDEHVGDELGRDRDAAFVLAVLPRVAVIGHHGGDAARGGAPRRVHHDEQFHQVLIDGRAGRLYDEDVAAADVFVDFDVDLAVREPGDGGVAQRLVAVVRTFSGRVPGCRCTSEFSSRP